jgi:hypothetical protein
MIDVIHSALVRGAGILQPKGHDHVFEQSHDTGYSECSLVYVFWGHENLVVADVAIHETQNLVASCRPLARIPMTFYHVNAREGPSIDFHGELSQDQSTLLNSWLNLPTELFAVVGGVGE